MSVGYCFLWLHLLRHRLGRRIWDGQLGYGVDDGLTDNFSSGIGNCGDFSPSCIGGCISVSISKLNIRLGGIRVAFSLCGMVSGLFVVLLSILSILITHLKIV